MMMAHSVQSGRDEEDCLSSVAASLSAICQKPEIFVRLKDDSDGVGVGGTTRKSNTAGELESLLKRLFDYSVMNLSSHLSPDVRLPGAPIDELYINGFDVESIWAQIELWNKLLLSWLGKTTKQLRGSDRLSLANDLDNDDSESNVEEEEGESDERHDDGEHQPPSRRLLSDAELEENSEGDEDDVSDHELDSNLSIEDNKFHHPRNAPPADNAVNSGKVRVREGFFDLNDMNNWGDEEQEGKWDGGEDENSDLNDDVLEELYGDAGYTNGGEGIGDDGRTARFKDFFTSKDYAEIGNGGIADEVAEERVVEREGKLGSSNNSGEKNLTVDAAAAKKLERNNDDITELEAGLLGEKPWEYRGEIGAKGRPVNSLLELGVDVERRTRAPPPITAEKTNDLEEMIKARISEGSFNDVQPKNIQLQKNFSSSHKVVDDPELSVNKSKEGLGDVYEAEFMRRTLGVERSDPNKVKKKELKDLFTKLCYKLDALSNFKFKPKPMIEDAEIVANLPAVEMEEALPVSMSAAVTTAPEERHAPKRGREGEFIVAEEMGQGDRKRNRLFKKRVRSKRRKQKASERKLAELAQPERAREYLGNDKKLLDELKRSDAVVEGRDDDTTMRGKNFFRTLQEVKEGGRRVRTPQVESKPASAAEFCL